MRFKTRRDLEANLKKFNLKWPKDLVDAMWAAYLREKTNKNTSRRHRKHNIRQRKPSCSA